MELNDLTDAQLNQLRIEVQTEQERRANLSQIPTQVTELVKTYRAGGGDENALMDAISAPDQ